MIYECLHNQVYSLAVEIIREIFYLFFNSSLPVTDFLSHATHSTQLQATAWEHADQEEA